MRYVEQHTATDDAIAGHVDREPRRTRRGECVDAHVVVELVVVDDVTERVDVAVGVAMHVHREPIRREFEAWDTNAIGGVPGHLVLGRFRVVG